MKKVTRRATSALLIAALLIVGLGIFVVRLSRDGYAWAVFRADQSVYSNGVLNTGTVTDRNGVLLASAGGGIYRYADDASVRTACLHAVGDYPGNIGTGAITAFSDLLSGYSFTEGTYDRDGSGGTVALSIDSQLCVTAYNALAGRKGAVLVYNYENGEILCMVSAPSYDPNYVPDLTAPAYEGAYINRALSSVYVPGSVFKLVTMSAAIENIDDLYTRSFYCGGSVQYGPDTVKCTGTHGSQTIEQALANSCNCAFAELALELGADTLAEYAEALGLTSSHSLNGIMTAAGSFDKAEDGTSLLAWSGIGQYNDLVSPYAMMRLAGGIANGGTVAEPTLLKGTSNGSSELIDPSTAEKLAGMMEYNVLYSYGSWMFPGLDICAKTGTAEVGDGTSHSWFVGFLEDDEHPYAFAVIAENAGGGLANAGAIANTVLQAAVS